MHAQDYIYVPHGEKLYQRNKEGWVKVCIETAFAGDKMHHKVLLVSHFFTEGIRILISRQKWANDMALCRVKCHA